MSWTFELVQTGPSGERERLRVAELGEVDAPSHVDEIGLGLTMSQRLLGRLQQALVAIQEAALRAKAVRMRAGDPTLRLKDYRRRQLAGLPIGTSTTEGLANTLVNRCMNKSQQMRWSVQGAHAVLAIRTAEVNGAMATTALQLAA